MEFLNQQLSAFVILLGSGILLGSFFDLYRVFRSRIKVNRMIDLIGDFIFWILAFVLLIPLIYWSTWLELRLYVWLTISAGIVFYYTVFSRFLIPVYRLFWEAASWLPGRLIHVGYGLVMGLCHLYQWLVAQARNPKNTPRS